MRQTSSILEVLCNQIFIFLSFFLMTSHRRTPGISAETLKESFGTPLYTFGVKAQGFASIWKEVVVTLALVGILGYCLFSAFQSINYLGLDYYFRERKS
jgi:hypothetical protein